MQSWDELKPCQRAHVPANTAQLAPGPCCLETLHLTGCSFVSVDLAAVTTLRDLDIAQAVRCPLQVPRIWPCYGPNFDALQTLHHVKRN